MSKISNPGWYPEFNMMLLEGIESLIEQCLPGGKYVGDEYMVPHRWPLF